MARPPASSDDATAQRYLASGWDLVKQQLGYGERVKKRSRGATNDDFADFPVLGAIGPTEVVGDDTTGGFYRRWQSKGHYLADLVRYILDNARMAEGSPEQRAMGLVYRLKDRPTFRDLVTSTATAELTSLDDDPAFAVALHMWSTARRYEWVRELLRQSYVDSTDHWAEAYDLILNLYGAELRSDFDCRRLAVVLSALLDGLAIRRGVDPDSVDENLFADAVLALLLGVLERRDDESGVTIAEAFDREVGAQGRLSLAPVG